MITLYNKTGAVKSQVILSGHENHPWKCDCDLLIQTRLLTDSNPSLHAKFVQLMLIFYKLQQSLPVQSHS